MLHVFYHIVWFGLGLSLALFIARRWPTTLHPAYFIWPFIGLGFSFIMMSGSILRMFALLGLQNSEVEMVVLMAGCLIAALGPLCYVLTALTGWPDKSDVE